MLNRVILNRVTLSKALLNRHNKNVSNQAKKYTVDDLIQLGYLTAYGNENEGYRIDTAQPLPMPIKDIKDFDAVFIGRSVPASVDTQRACMFNLSNTSHLTESQQEEIISKYNNKPNDRAISQLLFRNYTLPNADLKIIQNKTTEDSWQYSHKMFEGSTFNNVELNIKGSISSTNKLFMGITCNELEIYANSSSGNNMVAGTDIIAPHDTTEMFASSAINKYPRGVSYYRGLSNWTFTNNWNGKATEIPNVRGVETEEERITSPINVMKLPSGILYQTLWISSITRIGPVLDVTNVTGSEYIWGNCGIQLPNVTDIRIKGLNNLDWDFRGGATDKAFIPKMDEDSIIYCLNNVVEQTDTTRNIYFSTEVIKPTYEENSAKVKDALSNASTKGWNIYCGDTVLIIPDTPPVGNYIQFEDAEVERVLMANGVSSDGIGITIEDAEKVTSISTWFKNNKSISAFTELRFFTNVKTLVDNAFLACSSLKNVDLTNIETMGVRVFGDGGDLSEYDVDMPNLKTLSQGQWNQLFSKTNIRSIVNLGTITKLEGAGADASCFDHCVNLQSAYLPNTLTEIGYGTFAFCSSLTNVDIPSSVVTIGTDAFAQCKALEEFNIPQSVQSIGENAFGFDDNLQKLKVRASVPPSLATDNVFQCCPLIIIYVPDASLEAYKTATNWNTYADRIHPLSEIEGGHVTTFEGLIGAYTFEGRSNDDADRDIVEDKSGYNNTLTLKSMQWGFIHDNLPDLIREGFWDDALWISQSGYGEIALPKGLTDFTLIAKRFVYGATAGSTWSPLVGTGKSSGKGLFWLEYNTGDGKYTTQVNGLKHTLSSLESEVTWQTNTHYNGHRLTGTQGNDVHDGMVYINKFRGDVNATRFQKIYAIYLFNRQLSPSEIEAFIKEKIDASYVLPTIEQ